MKGGGLTDPGGPMVLRDAFDYIGHASGKGNEVHRQRGLKKN